MGTNEETFEKELTEQIVRDVARMLSEWEGSDELTTEFARRLVEFVRARISEAR